LGVLSKDGFCRPFDNDASGYTRAESVCVIFLQKSPDAKRVYANLVYSKTNNDGFKKTAITFPSGAMQIQLLRVFYEDLKMDPSKVDFVEAHCTGTKVGDPEESRTLDEIFCKGRNGKPLPVGSVKSNMGHAEATSGICSIAKVILAFHNQLIPPNIHYNEPREGIEALEQGRLQVVTKPQRLEGPLVCVNSFGFGGANAHALFKGSEKAKVNRGIPTDNLQRLVTWSGRTNEAVTIVLESVTKQPLDAEYVGLLQNSQIVSDSANTYRGYGIFTQDGNVDNAKNLLQHIQHFDGAKRPIVWVYSGMGSQWTEMGADLMKIPIVATSIEKSHLVLAARGLNLKEILTSTDPKMLDNILHSFVGIAAVQIALTDVLKALGLEPDHIIGHSVGELGCAYADGCLTAEEMILSAYSRGMASLETKMIVGSMAAVGVGYKKLCTMLPEGVEIACHNSADSSTISGPAAKVADFVGKLKSQNFFAKEVACSNIAYHSGYIAAMGPKLLSRLSEVMKTSKLRSAKWISSSVSKENWESSEAKCSSAKYHTNNLLSPVLFEEASNLLPKDALTIEIAPHGLLQAILKSSLPEAINIPLTKRGSKENSNFLLSAIGK
jgi:fatty acid synthase, animal type